jgi:hypothetical protein
MSGTLLWIMCVAIVLSLAAWLVAVAFANRKPAFQHPHVEPRRGNVQGATHVGGGRSVAPHRDAEIVPGEDPETPTVPVRRSRGTSPMDL